MLGVLLVASLIATAGEADAAAPAALDGCVAAPIGEDGWDYGCAGSNARVVDDPRHIDPETYLAGARGGARARVERPLDFARERTRLGGREAEVLRTTGGDVVEVTALVALPDGTRVLDCASRRPEWCATVLDALARTPWRGGAARGTVAVGAPSLRIGDLGPEVPSGCRARTVARGGQIVCPGGFLAGWATMPDDEALSRALGEFAGKMVAGPWPEERRAEIQPKELPCRIAGVAAACTWVTVSEGPKRFVAIWGGVTLKGVPTIAFCTSDGQATIPSPCSTVFEAR